ncbi:MAG TPA: putative baseplate assembly protein [Gemmatimonadaceae bacterium]|nr:putative baseplate assembly protein [Gemmatimonadaceae bacterium]
MTLLQLPNLDDRRWADLVEDARALIPQLAPAWTDHNVHDPGITVIELLASIAELDLYQLNRISDRHRRKFLELIGVEPQPPLAARGAVAFRLAPGVAHRSLPAGTELVERENTDPQVRVRTLAPLDVLPFELKAILIGTEDSLVDASARYTGSAIVTGPPPTVFRADGPEGQALYLGFKVDGTPTADSRLSVYLAFVGPAAGADARRRLLDERKENELACPPPSDRCRPCGLPVADETGEDDEDDRTSSLDAGPLRHHSAVTVWEYWHGARGQWTAAEAVDETRSFTLDGTVVIAIDAGMAARTLGPVVEPLVYVRCRLVSGELDVPPVIRAVAVNAVEVEQAVPVWQSWVITPSATISGTPPAPGGRSGLHLTFDADNRITALTFVDEAPRVTVLEFEKTPGAAGRLTLDVAAAGRAPGTPSLRLTLRRQPIVASTFRLLSLEESALRSWRRRADFLASRRTDAHFVLDPTRGLVDLGDGEHGRVAPSGARLFARYHATLAELGNVPAARSFELDDSPGNRARVGDIAAARHDLAAASNPVPIAGGVRAETLAHAIGRAIDDREAPRRAVTLTDYEILARQTPGTRIARASARANVRPGLACVSASGHVLVLIVPDSGAPRPAPSLGLRAAVTRYLSRRRIVGTRVEVIGPEYVAVAVRATIAAFPRLNKSEVRARAIAALNRFFDALRGGPDGTGWPFGRDVYRSEVLEILDRTEGVDRVESLAFTVEGCAGHCGNVCLPANGLVASGAHQIEVV